MTKIQASAGAFAAIAADGHVVAWGAQDRGGLVAPDVCLGVFATWKNTWGWLG